MKTTDYEKIYDTLKEYFSSQAVSHISDNAIEETLSREHQIMEQAADKKLSCSSWMGNNLARYSKDILRRQQPGFFVYYLLGIVTEFSGFLLLWILFSRTVSYLTGNHHAFLESTFQNLSLFLITAYLCYREVTSHICRNRLIKKNSLAWYRLPGLAAGTAIGIIGVLVYCFQPEAGLSISLFQAFLLYAGMLFLSGIHNTIYSSHALQFWRIALLRFARRNHAADELNNAVSLYFSMKKKQMPGKSLSEIMDSTKYSLISTRAYCFLGLLIDIVLIPLSIHQLLQNNPTVSMILFTVLALLLFVLLSAAVSVCNLLLKENGRLKI